MFAFFRQLRTDWAGITRSHADRKAIVTLIASVVLIVVFAYWGRPSFFRRYQGMVAGLMGWSPEHEFYSMLPYIYWAATSLLIRVLIPMVIVVYLFRERPWDNGFRIRGVTPLVKIYPLLFIGMLPVLFLASLSSGFQNKYPFYDQAALGWDHFVLYETAHGIEFMGVEAFFRGFMTFGLFARFGYSGLFIMVIPYCMVHFGKPAAEVFAAIPAGLLLGYLALKTRSWFYGALLHWAVAITMDLMVIMQEGGFRPESL